MEEREPGSGAQPEGLFAPLRSALSSIGSALHTRLELFATELEEERERLKLTLALMLLVFFGLSLGLILLTIFIVALLWQGGWVFALGALAAVYLAIGVAAALMLRQKILTRPGLFSTTLAELAKDCERLKSTSHD